MYKIIIDGEGGDRAPAEIVRACATACDEVKDIELLITGREDVLREEMARQNVTSGRIRLIPCGEPLTMEDAPDSVVRSKKTSSLGAALSMLAAGEADALVSAGNSGALLVGGSLLVRRIKGVKRAAFAPIFPTATGHLMLIDSGATVDAKADFMEQYGVLGSAYMKAVYGVEEPRVGLANNGAEECKGTDIYKEAHARLKANPHIRFIGNVECRDIMTGVCDVLVADGFVGNMILKSSEGMGLYLLGGIKEVFTKNLRTKIAYLLVKPELKAFKKKVDYKETGGAVLLGLTKPVIKAHGSSDARAFKNSILQAYRIASTDMIARLTDTFAAMKEENADG